MFGFLKKKEAKAELPAVSAADHEIVAMADGELIEVSGVSDPVFAQKVMGESVAFLYEGDKVVVCAPANGTLSALFPTGHAFGITMKNGMELLVHIGINTVASNGDGFRILDKKQEDPVKAGDPIVEVDLKKLSQQYDMPVMLIVTNPNGQEVHFKARGKVARGECVIC